MGYDIETGEVKFSILAENVDSAYKAIIELADSEEEYWWVDKDGLKKAATLEEAVKEWGWELEKPDPFGGYHGIYFEWEKLGHEKTMFTAIAPFVEDGSFIEVLGEDGERWKWCFENGNLVEKWGRVIYE